LEGTLFIARIASGAHSHFVRVNFIYLLSQLTYRKNMNNKKILLYKRSVKLINVYL